jgi:hypothetical protein
MTAYSVFSKYYLNLKNFIKLTDSESTNNKINIVGKDFSLFYLHLGEEFLFLSMIERFVEI